MRNKVIEIARNELGYKEYADNKTKYGDWYGMVGEWCNMFVSWVCNQAGVPTDIVPKQSYVPTTYSWYKSRNLFKARGTYNPIVGDIVLFDYNGNGNPDHIGFVESVSNGKLITIEGNKSKKVMRCTYNLNNTGIFGYCVPNYTVYEPSNETIYPVLKKGSKGDSVKDAQNKLINKGYNLSRYGADGDFGAETEVAVKELQKDANLAVDGIIGEKTWEVLNGDFIKPTKVEYPGFLIRYGQSSDTVKQVQERLIALGYSCGPYGADGIFGIETAKAVENFQRDNGLSVDGIVGPATWEKLF